MTLRRRIVSGTLFAMLILPGTIWAQESRATVIGRVTDATGAVDPDARVLGITAQDLFVPVLTFVFGEAQLEGHCTVVSMHRLREEFYGLPPRDDLMRERLVKEAVHELGHTHGLRHCQDWRCVMSSSHGVERLDIKGADFCLPCHRTLIRDRHGFSNFR